MDGRKVVLNIVISMLVNMMDPAKTKADISKQKWKQRGIIPWTDMPQEWIFRMERKSRGRHGVQDLLFQVSELTLMKT